MGLMQTHYFNKEVMGPERQSNFLKASLLFNGRVGTGAQAPAVMLFSHTTLHVYLMRIDMVFYEEMLGRKLSFIKTLFLPNCARCVIFIGSFDSNSPSAKERGPLSHFKQQNSEFTSLSVGYKAPTPSPSLCLWLLPLTSFPRGLLSHFEAPSDRLKWEVLNGKVTLC